MDQMDGIGLLKELQNRWPGLKVIMLTAHGTIPDAVQATQMGAFGFLTKPVDKQELLDQVQKALKISGFVDNSEEWRENIITRSALMEEKLSQAHMVAGTDARVLISGEEGSGKAQLAKAVHKASPRKNKPFLAVNCGSMAEDALEAELFGYAKGAVANARADYKGLFEQAAGGTLLLERVDELPMGLQVKLLRLLTDNMVRPVGSAEGVNVDTRVISTTNRDLQQLSGSGAFRGDLYYRLNVVQIEMPALARRREDIPLLGRAFPRGNGRRDRDPQDLRAGSRRAAGHPPSGRATSGSCATWCARTWPSRRRPSFRWSWCSSRWAAVPAGCPPSTRHATSSRAATCHPSCRSRAAT